MERKRIPVSEFSALPVDIWQTSWMLLSSGNLAAKKFNCMTISWGFLGVMWGKPMAICGVRPQRHTRKFLDEFDNFSLCVFPREHKHLLDILGSRSGREIDKINKSGFTPQPALKISSPLYAEAELAIECRKVYFHDLDPAHFLADYIGGLYNNDYHRLYLGEIVAISGTDTYRKPK